MSWVNRQPLAAVVTCLGDGHDGVWNLISGITPIDHRREVLDWYHLVENLHKVGGSQQRLQQVKTDLWHGRIDQALVRLCWVGYTALSRTFSPICTSIITAYRITKPTSSKAFASGLEPSNRP